MLWRVAGHGMQVTLHDCLACSGCITSAETILLQHQSSEVGGCARLQAACRHGSMQGHSMSAYMLCLIDQPCVRSTGPTAVGAPCLDMQAMPIITCMITCCALPAAGTPYPLRQSEEFLARLGITSSSGTSSSSSSGTDAPRRMAGDVAVVVSISAQSRTSLAAVCGLNGLSALRRAVAFLRGLGCTAVYD